MWNSPLDYYHFSLCVHHPPSIRKEINWTLPPYIPLRIFSSWQRRKSQIRTVPSSEQVQNLVSNGAKLVEGEGVGEDTYGNLMSLGKIRDRCLILRGISRLTLHGRLIEFCKMSSLCCGTRLMSNTNSSLMCVMRPRLTEEYQNKALSVWRVPHVNREHLFLLWIFLYSCFIQEGGKRYFNLMGVLWYTSIIWHNKLYQNFWKDLSVW